MSKNIYSTQSFIQKAQIVHNNKYDYSKVVYKNTGTKVTIICPDHGEFLQTPSNHLKGHGCIKCSDLKRYKMNTDLFVDMAKKVHGSKYDYSKTKYVNWKTKVTIICPIHGEFKQSHNQHLYGHGCPKCALANNKTCHPDTLTLEEFINRSRIIHGDKYDYSKVKYVNNGTKVIIICPIHGEFWQTPNQHIIGSACRKCSNESKRLTKDDFINRSQKIHNNKYDYSKVDYKNYSSLVTIICPTHGAFEQLPRIHLVGHGCKKCNHHGFNYKNPDQPGILYFILARAGTEKFCKVGVSIRSLQERFEHEPIEILDYNVFPGNNIGKLHDLEQFIIHSKLFDGDRFYPKTQFGGVTECFTEAAYPKILQFIKENINPNQD